MNLAVGIKDEGEGVKYYMKEAEKAPTPEIKNILLAHAQDEERHKKEDKLIQEGRAREITFSTVGRLPANTPHNVHNLAEVNPDGSIWVNPKVPEVFHGLRLRERVYVYEDTVRRLRSLGWSDEEAKRQALEHSHMGLTRHQIEVMEGKLGSIGQG
jgi:rubrerythrin